MQLVNDEHEDQTRSSVGSSSNLILWRHDLAGIADLWQSWTSKRAWVRASPYDPGRRSGIVKTRQAKKTPFERPAARWRPPRMMVDRHWLVRPD